METGSPARPRDGEPAPPEASYDAFVSYASSDQRGARRVQRFLESWVDRRAGRRLRVFLDETDVRGGTLDVELRRAAHAARTLIVCHSPAASESRWVEKEVRLFRERAEPDRIAVAIVGGRAAPESVGRGLVPGAELRVHDLRRGRWLGPIGLGVKLELLRLLAFVADVDLRALRNWHLRRVLTRGALLVVCALAPPLLLLNLPLEDWLRLDVRLRGEPIYAVAAEAGGGKLRVMTRFRGHTALGFRDDIQVVEDALGREPRAEFHDVALRRRLRPVSRLPYEMQGRIPRVDVGAHTRREGVGPPLAAEIADGRFVVLVPLALTQEEIDAARDDSLDSSTPIPVVKGSLVATIDGGATVVSEVADLSPVWEEREGFGRPASPSRGPAVAWSPEGDVWLGVQGRDEREAGGLWLRPGGGGAWERVPGFVSVQSIELDGRDGRTRGVVVAEKHLELWRGIRLVSRPTRVVVRRAGESTWRPAPAPPYGTRSEVELVGRLDGARVVRVDERLYRQSTLPSGDSCSPDSVEVTPRRPRRTDAPPACREVRPVIALPPLAAESRVSGSGGPQDVGRIAARRRALSSARARQLTPQASERSTSRRPTEALLVEIAPGGPTWRPTAAPRNRIQASTSRRCRDASGAS